MAQDNFVFNEYKPLRNHLNKTKLDDSLFAIWAYTQHLQFNNPLPDEVEVIPEFRNADHIQKIRWCAPWELEVLAREIIINSTEIGSDQTILKWNYFAGAINKLKNLENKIDGRYINQNNILSQFFRIAHRQFPWQSGPNSALLTRYYKIFSTPELNEILKKSIGLPTEELYFLGMLFVGAYLNHASINLPIDIEIENINQDTIEKFLNCFCSPLSHLKDRVKQDQEMNDKFAYSFSSLRAFPIIKMDFRGKERLACPLPTLLYWRITNSVYYEVCNEKGFDNCFGSSFQKYAEEVIRKATTNGGITEFLPEEEYQVGKNRKDTVDLIIYDSNATLFIECKTKRLKLPAKFELGDSKYVDEDLEKMSDFIVQIYKTIKDYKNNKYPSFKYKNNRKIYPIVLTLEHWYLFNDKLLVKLDTMIAEKLKQEGIDISDLNHMPYSICAVDEFEKVVQIIQKTGISNFMDKKVFDDEKKKWDFEPYMLNEFTNYYKDVKFLFEDDFHNLFDKYTKK